MQFGSDNQVGASSQILEAIMQANSGYAHGYGNDAWTEQAVKVLREVFECELEAFFVTTGTAANCLALSSIVEPWQTVFCHHQAHIALDESTAPEWFTHGARLIPLAHGEGKLRAQHILDHLQGVTVDKPHNPKASALSLTQSSELGLVYTPEEVSSLCEVARSYELKVHMDGARFANAIAALGCTPAEATWKAGVDILCLGATKCGALAAEAIIFFKPELAKGLMHRRKRSGHLLSKGRFLGAQFIGWFENHHWLTLAQHANQQAKQLSEQLNSFSEIQLAWPTQSNEIMAILPKPTIAHLQSVGAEFYPWYSHSLPREITLHDDQAVIRLVTNFTTTEQQIEEFCEEIQRTL